MPQRTKSEELLELAQEAGGLGIFEWNLEDGTVGLSERFISSYGLDGFDGRYESWLQSIHREDQMRIGSLLEDAFAEKRSAWQAEFRIRNNATGEVKWVEAHNVIAYDIAGRVLRVFGVTVDITERKSAEVKLAAFTHALEEAVKERTRQLEVENEARRRAEELLRQALKMEAVGQLTGGIAHDFNNLLTVVLGGLDIIGRNVPELHPAPAVIRIARARDMAMNGLQRAIVLTSRLLAFSRQQALAPQVIDANKLVAGVCDLLQRTLGEGIYVETVLAGGLWRSFADPNQLENSVVNLALNARDAMPNGGKLTIETANCYLDAAYIASLPEPVEAGHYIMIAVSDTGKGMDEPTRERAFDPFFTTKEVGKGTGLGLSQVYGFVRQTDGHVKIYSEVGEGTTVKIYLRRYAGESGRNIAGDLHQSNVAQHAIDGETILVVEDDEPLRGYTIETLRELGYTVLEASDGPTALKVLAANHVDLLFTDVVMPGGMSGRDLADAATRLRAGLKVLYTTGYTRNAIVHHGRVDAGVQMIGKPFSSSELSTKIRELLDQ